MARSTVASMRRRHPDDDAGALRDNRQARRRPGRVEVGKRHRVDGTRTEEALVPALGRQVLEEGPDGRRVGRRSPARTCSVEPSRRTTSHPVSGTAEASMPPAGATSLPAADGADPAENRGRLGISPPGARYSAIARAAAARSRGPGSQRQRAATRSCRGGAKPSDRAAGRAGRRARPPSRPRPRRPGRGSGRLAPRGWRRATARRMALRPAPPRRQLASRSS